MRKGEELFQSMHTRHNQGFPAGLDYCPECRADAIKNIMRRLNDGDERFDSLQHAMAENTRITKENSETLKDVREIVVMGRSLFRIAGAIGNGIKWIGGIVVASAAAWAVIEKYFPWSK